jgi:hypothetical protein
MTADFWRKRKCKFATTSKPGNNDATKHSLTLYSLFVNVFSGFLEKAGMQDDIDIVCDDVKNHEQLLRDADVIMFFNSFELHNKRAGHWAMLRWLRKVCSVVYMTLFLFCLCFMCFLCVCMM